MIGFVEGKGTTTETQSYYFADENLNPATYSYRLKQIDLDGSFEYSKEIEVEVGIPDNFTLYQNYPNPFNPATIISWQLPVGSHVTLKIYDLLGREITTLVDKEFEAGKYETVFDASEYSSGIYLYRLTASDFISSGKMQLIK